MPEVIGPHRPVDVRVRLGLAGAAALVAVSLPLGATQSPDSTRQEVRAYLARAGFADEDIGKVHAGEVIARSETGDNGEILTAGAVLVRASRERVLRYYGQLASYVDGEVTLAFGRFSTPPALSDVAGLAFDPDEIEELKSCRVGDCDIRLGGRSLEQLRSAVDWNAPDYADRVNTLARQSAVAYVTDYLARGDAALVTFNDRDEPVSMREHWTGILANSPHFHEYVPELRTYLEQFPANPPPGARDILYWVKGDYGLKPVISIVHGVIYSAPARPDRDIVVQKHIYASHYYDGSLAVATLLSADPVTTYVLYGNRSRGDLLRGGLGGVRRGVARSQAANATRDTLGAIKRVLERQPGS